MKNPEKLAREQERMKAESESWPMTYPIWLDLAWKRWKQRETYQMQGEIYGSVRDKAPADSGEKGPIRENSGLDPEANR